MEEKNCYLKNHFGIDDGHYISACAFHMREVIPDRFLFGPDNDERSPGFAERCEGFENE